MSKLGEVAGDPGTVEIAGRVFIIAPISLREEAALAKQWEAIARLDDKKRNAAAFKLIQEAPEELRDEMSREMVREAKRGNPLSNYAIYKEARESPAGVAREMFARTRGAHPDVKLEDFEAIINDKNAGEVNEAITAALETCNPKGQTP